MYRVWGIGLAVVGLLTVGAAPAAADDTAPPTTVPTITAPADAAMVAGDVTLTATTTNPSATPSVQFFVDGNALGPPVAVDAVSSTATTTWPAWGLSHGSYAITAEDCNVIGCNTTASTAVSVDLENAAPVLTYPPLNTTTTEMPTFTATAAGGGVSFVVDGTPAGFDNTAPYSLTVGPLSDGPHSIGLVECDLAGTSCHGAASNAVSFLVVTLHPTITSVVPPTISPNHDGQSDTTAFRIHLPDAETVSFHVENGNGQTVSGPHTAGALAAGDHVYHWDGKNNAGKVAGDGAYTIVAQSTAQRNGTTVHGRGTAPVIVDDTAPLLTGVTGNNTAFYPIIDGYRDTFQPSVHVNEGGRLWLEIFTTKGALVKTIAQPHAAAGTFTPVWNGTDARRRLMTDGAYRYKFIADDAGHNRRTSAAYVVHLSRERIVNRVTTFTQNGNAGLLFTTDTSCTGYSYDLSLFPHGVWLSNVCDPSNNNFQVVSADYLFKVPAAVRYNNIRVESYGNTGSAPEPLLSIIYNNATKQYDAVGAVNLTKNDANVHTTYGTVHGGAYVDSSHLLDVSLGLPNAVSPEDYDIGTVTITVSYSLLQ